jgi:uncharacterized membrane protein
VTIGFSKIVLGSLFTLSTTIPVGATVPRFQGLGDMPGGNNSTRPLAVSADSFTVVGHGRSANGEEAFRWTRAGVIEGLGDLPGGDFDSRAFGVSGDGSIIVGISELEKPFRWTRESGIQPLPRELGDTLAISADGSTIAGSNTILTPGGIVNLGRLSSAYSYAQAYALDADGSVVVGRAQNYRPEMGIGFEAFRWTAEEGMTALGDFPGGRYFSEATGTSADGSVIVGRGHSAAGSEAFRWTADEGLVSLGDLPGGRHESGAFAASADGSVIVGYANVAPGSNGITSPGHTAFIWDEVRGMRHIQKVLEDEVGLDLAGWDLWAASDISADGHTIVGWGFNPEGRQEGWIATMPEPSVAMAALSVSALLLMRHRHRRNNSRG